jgi:hypothetical protein
MQDGVNYYFANSFTYQARLLPAYYCNVISGGYIRDYCGGLTAIALYEENGLVDN